MLFPIIGSYLNLDIVEYWIAVNSSLRNHQDKGAEQNFF